MSSISRELIHNETPEQRLEAFLRAAYLASIVEQDSERGKRKTNPLHKGVADYILACAQRAGRDMRLVGLDSEYKARAVGKPVVHGRFITEKQGDASFSEVDPEATVCVEVKFPTKTYGKNEINHFEILLGQVANLKLRKESAAQRFFFVQIRRTEFPVEDSKGNSAESTEKLNDDRLKKYREMMSLSGEREEVVKPDHLLFVLVDVKTLATGKVPEVEYRESKEELRSRAKGELEAFESFLDNLRASENVEYEEQFFGVRSRDASASYLDSLSRLLPQTKTNKSKVNREEGCALVSSLASDFLQLFAASGEVTKMRKAVLAKKKKLVESCIKSDETLAVIDAAFSHQFETAVSALSRKVDASRQTWLTSRWPGLSFQIANQLSTGYTAADGESTLTQESLDFLHEYGPRVDAHLAIFKQ